MNPKYESSSSALTAVQVNADTVYTYSNIYIIGTISKNLY